MATGTVSALSEPALVDSRVASAITTADFAGVQGNSTTTVRAVGSSANGVEMPKGVTALSLIARPTNAPGGGATDVVYPVLEVLIGSEWYQIIATAGIPMNSTAADPGVATAFATQNAASIVPVALLVPFDAAAGAGLQGATGNQSNFGWQAASRVRIGINVTHPGAPAGSMNLHVELWTIPYRGTTR